MIDSARLWRWTKTTQTWLSKTTHLLVTLGEQARGEQRWAIGYEAERLMSFALEDLAELVPLLDEEQTGQALDRASKLRAKLRDRKLGISLGRVEGRTPVEAEAFRAKAAELLAKEAAR